MEYSHSDTQLVGQPIGYWSWAASHAVVTYIRAQLAQVGLSQPQWWTLAQVDGSEHGKTRAEVTAVLHGYLGVGDALRPEIDALLDRGLLEVDDDERLRLTATGAALFRRAAEVQTANRAQIHAGVPDDEYVTTLKVLQRMIHNVGGTAWHH
jgi:MarR family transcriptional regulator, organic hydroperoxide resistance regulator